MSQVHDPFSWCQPPRCQPVNDPSAAWPARLRLWCDDADGGRLRCLVVAIIGGPSRVCGAALRWTATSLCPTRRGNPVARVAASLRQACDKSKQGLKLAVCLISRIQNGLQLIQRHRLGLACARRSHSSDRFFAGHQRLKRQGVLSGNPGHHDAEGIRNRQPHRREHSGCLVFNLLASAHARRCSWLGPLYKDYLGLNRGSIRPRNQSGG